MTETNGNKADPLTQFLSDAKHFPMLTLEHEQELVRAWHKDRDQAALRQLVGSHLRLVVKIARRFSGYGLPLADLIGEGNIGLMQAVQKFVPDRGCRFASYAIWWIRTAIQEHIMHSTSIVKMGTTGARKKLFCNLRRMKSRLGHFDGGDLAPETVATIAITLGVPEKEVVEMNRRLGSADGSLNVMLREDGDTEWLDLLVDEGPSQEWVLAEADELARRRKLLGEAMAQLSERERVIVVERWLRDAPVTLEELGHRFKVSRERIRQLEVRAVDKLRKAMTKTVLGGPLPAQAAAWAARRSSVDSDQQSPRLSQP